MDNCSFVKDHIVVRSDISPSDPSSHESADVAGVLGSSGVGLSQCSQSLQRWGKGDQARKHHQEQVDEAVTASSNPRKAWANWIGTELQDLPQHQWTLYQKESFALVMKYKEGVQAQQQPRQQPQQPQQPHLTPRFAPRPASVPLASMTTTSTMSFQLQHRLQ